MKKIALLTIAAIAALGFVYADATVKSVKGTVGVMLAPGKLQPATVGMKLADDATVVTGAASELVVEANNGTLTFKSLTTAKIRGVAMTKTSSTADVALKGGTVVSEVKQITGLKTSFTVTTPVGTSSVRGTSHTVSYGPGFGMAVSVSSGVVAVSTPRGATKPVPAGASLQAGAGSAPPVVTSQAAKDAEAPSAASAFSSPDEAPAAVGGAAPSAVDDLIRVVEKPSTDGTVALTLVFP